MRKFVYLFPAVHTAFNRASLIWYHRQFGNMLVLSAAYKSKTLGAFVEPQKLDYLFGRTIKLLKTCSPISMTLAKDCYILECLRKVIFENSSEPMTNSFSSE